MAKTSYLNFKVDRKKEYYKNSKPKQFSPIVIANGEYIIFEILR